MSRGNLSANPLKTFNYRPGKAEKHFDACLPYFRQYLIRDLTSAPKVLAAILQV